MTIEEILTIIAPEIPDDERRTFFIDDTKTLLSPASWDSKYNTAVAYLTAHRMTVLNSRTGTVKRKKAGEEEIEYFASKNSLYSTHYGQEFLQLQKSTISCFSWSNNHDNK